MKRFFFYCTLSAISFLLVSASCSKPAADAGNKYNIRVTTFAGKGGVAGLVDAKGDAARFSSPGQLVFDERNQTLYAADQGFNGLTIRAIDLEGNVTTYVGINT